MSIALQLNYANVFKDQIFAQGIFHQLHQSAWNKALPIGDYFLFQKQHVNVLDLEITSNRFDVIFFDAFAPAAQQELWQLNLFEKMFDALNRNGILVTYCSKGEVRRTMQAAGFIVEKIPGPPGKREMLRARKI
jgi:tRNA U34 5-methylaminomethyl-2-thiouridine-forming methyltransferase MnmC